MTRLVAAACAGLAAAVVGGCACNTTNSFDQQYCATYSGITPGPAALMGIGFFVFVLVVGLLFRRLTRPEAAIPSPIREPTGARSGPPWSVVDGPGREASLVLRELEAAGAAVSAWERFDGAWMIEVRVPGADPPFEFVSEWGSRERASRDVLEALVAGGLVRLGESGP